MSEQTTLVRVTSEHIKHGEPDDCGKCPVALALLDAIPYATDVAVDHDELTVWVPGHMWQASTPPAAQLFIAEFDNFEPVAPFDFTVTWRVEQHWEQEP